MGRVRKRAALVVGAMVTLGLSVPVPADARTVTAVGAALGAASGAEQAYVVLADDGAAVARAGAAVTAAGGTVTGVDTDLGVLTATSARTDFAARVDAQAGVLGVARNQVVGSLPKQDPADAELRAVAQQAAASAASDTGARGKKPPAAEPFANLQPDMQMIGATATGSYAVQRGKRGVLVGVLDSGIDGNHPDIAPNFDRKLSRNFVTDIPSLDGPCEHPSCVDPVDQDDDGHGTHVAGTIGSPINGIGIAGVAPGVTLVNIRVGQDAGFIFLEPAIKALKYAGDIGVDVVNMSFYIDPWLYNCQANPADSPAEQAEQRTIVAATQRALDYAHKRGVTLVAALGNEHQDLGNPLPDLSSPDYPAGTAHPRTIDNATCLNMPTEGRHVISVASIGYSGKKADYSNHGLEQNDVSAPGGFYRDFAGTPRNRTVANLVLAPMPHHVALLSGSVDPATGQSTDPFVVSSCSAPGPDHCAYWQYLQGTSMAAPHATGVVALIVSQYGERDGRHPGLTMEPEKVERVLRATATDVACPSAVVSYAAEGRSAEFDAPCVGTAARNSLYGDGIVNALRAVTRRR